MGRQVLNVPRHAADKESLRRSAVIEQALSAFYVVMMGIFGCGCLSFTPLVPYMSGLRWWFFAVAAFGFLLVNCRDLWMITRLYSPKEPANDEDSNQSIEPLVAAKIRRASTTESLFNADTISVAFMLLGSVLLLNSSVFSLLDSELTPTARWQFLAAFTFFSLGYACNTLRFHDECLEILETRNAVVFQMSMASTLNLIGAITNVPGMGCDSNEELRATLRSWLHGLAGFVAFGGVLVNHFHVHAFNTNEEVLFAERLYMRVKNREVEKKEALANRSVREKLWGFIANQFGRLFRGRRSLERSKNMASEADGQNRGNEIYVPLSDSEVSESYSGDSMVDSDFYDEEEAEVLDEVEEDDGEETQSQPFREGSDEQQNRFGPPEEDEYEIHAMEGEDLIAEERGGATGRRNRSSYSSPPSLERRYRGDSQGRFSSDVTHTSRGHDRSSRRR